MSLLVKSVLLIWLVLVPLVINGEKYVTIHNDLEGGEILFVHCKSKDDDPGPNVLAHGQLYEFSFTPHWIGNTTYFCSFQIEDKCYWFNIYDYRRDYSYCDHCDWFIHRNGPCKHFKAPGPDCLPWNQDTCKII
ncbi:hypothetical protein HN51_067187 [Arachis hypogaea]|nr:Leguminosin secreted peptide [Arachis hypogaea]